MNNRIDLGLGVNYPYLSEASIARLKAFAPDSDPIQFGNPKIILPEETKNNPEEYVDVLDMENISLYSGTLAVVYYPGRLTDDEYTRLSHALPPDQPAELTHTGEFAFYLYWALSNFRNNRSLKYRFVWGFHPTGTERYLMVNTQKMAVNALEPWFHVFLQMDAHTAHAVLGDPIKEPLPL